MAESVTHRLSRLTRPMNSNKWGSFKRLALVHGLSRVLPIYIVNEFPKSGGTWISNMIARALRVPFRDNQIPRLERCLIKGHFLRKGGMGRPVVVWRDGRDVMVSYYYHSYFKFADSSMNHDYVDVMRRLFPFDDYDDVRGNMPRFIEQQFSRPFSPMFTWTDFVNVWWDDTQAIHVRYEDMRAGTATELSRVVSELSAKPFPAAEAAKIADTYSIKRMRAGTKPGRGQTSFVRKGATGNWVNHFTTETSEIFEHHAGRALDMTGYPRDARLK